MTQKTGLSDIAYDEIKTMILQNKLKPGQFVNEAQLQEILGLGRTPVREAVLRLAGNDLITVHPRKGIEISTISPKTIHDIFQVRIIMEPAILQTGCGNLDRQKLLDFRARFQAYSQMDPSSVSVEQSLQIAQLDNEFHLYIVDSLENRYASQMMSIFVDKLTMIRSAVSTGSKTRLSVSTQEHLEIIDAILDGRINTACSRLRKHIEVSYEEAIRTLVYLY